jgi:replicative DNA helicase
MTKIAKDSFSYLGPDFQIRLLAQIITDNKFAESIIEILDPNYFKDQSLKLITSSIKDAYSEYNIIPDYGSLEIRLLNSISSELDQKFTLTQLKKIKEASLNDGLVIQDMAMKFCKQEELKKSIKEIQTIIDKGDMSRYEDCEEILKKALSHGEQKDNGLNVLDNIDAVLEDDFRKPIPTGIKGLDEVMDGGLSKGELAIILAPFGVGKAQPLYSKILTPNGWTRMGDINVGDYVIGRDGKSTKVTEVFPQGKRPIYTVKFNDNTQTLCDAEHLWAVNTINQRNRKTKKAGKIVYLEPDNTFKVMKTIDMINSTKVWSGKRLNYKIPTVLPVEFNKKDLTINPYLLGVILGDGCVTTNNQPHFVTKDYDIISEVSKIYNNISITEQTRDIEKDINGELVLVKRSLTKVSLLGIKESLIKLNLYGTNSSTKFIPKDYLYSSVCDRVSLLQGLVDTDGYIDAHRVEISTVSKQLSEDIKELILSLGGKVSISEKNGKYDNKLAFINNFHTLPLLIRSI